MRKRSKYKPKPVRDDAYAWVINGLRPVDTHASKGAMANRLIASNSLSEMVLGRGDAQHAQNIREMVMVVKGLAMQGIGSDWMPEIEQAMAAIKAVEARGGSYVFWADELKAIRLAVELHDAQLSAATIGHMDNVFQMVQEGKIK
jgi:hypothetical protein